MPFFARALLLVLVAGVTACKQGDVAVQPAASEISASSASQTVPVAVSPTSAVSAPLVKGIYTWGPEVETFSPCNSSKTYWLEGNETSLAPLQEMALKKADAGNEAYQPIYVELHATHAGKATDGFAVDYDGLMQLQDVVQASGNVPADCKLLNEDSQSAQ